MTPAPNPARAFRREATGAVPFGSFAASAEEVDDSAWSGESVALGWREADVECGFKLITELNQVERVATEVANKDGVEAHFRRRKVEVPRDDGLHTCLYRSFHLPSSLTLKCQGNVNDRQFRNGFATREIQHSTVNCSKSYQQKSIHGAYQTP